jgi:hypothetical protein
MVTQREFVPNLYRYLRGQEGKPSLAWTNGLLESTTTRKVEGGRLGVEQDVAEEEGGIVSCLAGAIQVARTQPPSLASTLCIRDLFDFHLERAQII